LAGRRVHRRRRRLADRAPFDARESVFRSIVDAALHMVCGVVEPDRLRSHRVHPKG
jgi:hypothetical protein